MSFQLPATGSSTGTLHWAGASSICVIYPSRPSSLALGLRVCRRWWVGVGMGWSVGGVRVRHMLASFFFSVACFRLFSMHAGQVPLQSMSFILLAHPRFQSRSLGILAQPRSSSASGCVECGGLVQVWGGRWVGCGLGICWLLFGFSVACFRLFGRLSRHLVGPSTGTSQVPRQAPRQTQAETYDIYLYYEYIYICSRHLACTS